MQRAALSASAARAWGGVQCARLSCAGTFRCGAVNLTHFVRTLCMWVKIAAIGRAFAGRVGSPRGRVEILDEKLVYAIVRGKGLDCGPAELSVNLGWTRGHGSCSLPYHTDSEVLYCSRCPTIACLYP